MKPKSSFWFSPTYHIIKAMQATGNGPGVIRQWVNSLAEAAEKYPGTEAEAVKAWLPHWQVRPFYTAEELAPIWPALAVALKFTDKMYAQHHPARLKRELEWGRLPKLKGYDRYFIVEHLHFWKNVTLTQQELEEVMRSAR